MSDVHPPTPPVTVREAILSCMESWEADEFLHELWVYLVNELGVDPEQTIDDLRENLTIAERALALRAEPPIALVDRAIAACPGKPTQQAAFVHGWHACWYDIVNAGRSASEPLA